MNLQAVEKLHGLGVGLIVTVDNGIASVKEVERARELGMDVVVTDHHRPQERLPQAAAVVDAHQPGDSSPFKELCGAGVALKLVMALEGGDPQDILEEYADLAALGTVPMWCLCWGKTGRSSRRGFPFWPGAAGRGGRLMEESGMGARRPPPPAWPSLSSPASTPPAAWAPRTGLSAF